MKKQCKTTAVAAKVKRGTGTIEKNTVGKLKRGWNWEYTFCEKVLSYGKSSVIVLDRRDQDFIDHIRGKGGEK